MEKESQTTERLYQETMDAIHSWVRGQGKNGMSVAEARGVAKAFLTHASMALVSTLGGNASDSRRLTQYFFEAILRFTQEKMNDGD